MGRCTRVTTALLSLTFLTLGGCQNVDAGFYDADEMRRARRATTRGGGGAGGGGPLSHQPIA